MILIVACNSSRAAESPRPQGPPPMPVEIAPVQATRLRDVSEYVAVLRSRQSVQVQPQVQGYVTDIEVKSGDRVNPGSVLMQIDPARQQATANAQKAAREANLASRDYWRMQYQRVEKLYAGGAATRQDLDQARTALQQAEANAASSAAQERAAVVELRYYNVKATAAGTVGDIPVRIGDYVTPQTLLTTLDDNDTLEAYVDIPIERAGIVHLGTPVEIIDATGKLLATSSVTFVSPRADPTTQLVLIKAAVDNPDQRLRAAQFVTARVVWSERVGPAVPVLAVQSRAGQAFVWAVQSAPGGGLTANPRPVQVGPIQGQSYPVLKGVAVGEQIVVSGVQKLRPGAPVAPINGQASGGAQPAGQPTGQTPGVPPREQPAKKTGE
jgi:RND family efflux transporter MFP subunit